MMGPHSSRPFGSRSARALLVLAAANQAGLGGWALAYPAGLFQWLNLSAPDDALLLWRLLGAVILMQAGCAMAAAVSPRNAGLILVPLTGRILLAGIWLWLMETQRVTVRQGALVALLVHDGAWLGIVVIGFVVQRAQGDGIPRDLDGVR